jgi:hypothetical protein
VGVHVPQTGNDVLTRSVDHTCTIGGRGRGRGRFR